MQQGNLYGICAPIEKLIALNKKLGSTLDLIKMTPFFRTYKINLERECPFWAQQRLCNNNKCSVCECEEKDVPTFWSEMKSQPLPDLGPKLQEMRNVRKTHDSFSSSFTSSIFMPSSG